VHLAGFDPAFTLSLGDSERSCKPPYSYGLCNRIDIIYLDEIANIESLTENIKNLD
jgi:hypothetical protein